MLRNGITLMAILASFAGCSPAAPPKAPVQSVSTATILSMREVNPRVAADVPRTSLLAAGDEHGDDARSLTEFIVRTNDGAVLSIVQSNDGGFHKGDRVVIVHGDRTRLARPAEQGS